MRFEWRALRPGETDHEALWLSVAAALAVMFAVWVRFVEWPPMVCPFNVVTGLPCLTCGATRALFAFAGGEVIAAVRFNPLVGLSLAASIPYLCYAGAVVMCGTRRLRVSVAPAGAVWLRAAAFTAIVASWAFLIVDGR